MEELNLGDLDFDTDNLQLFDEGEDIVKKVELTPAPAGDGSEASNLDDKNKDKTNTDSDDPNKDQESVADQSKDNQVQAGETASSDETGGNSSSPKLNETEQLYSNLAAEFKAKGVLPGLDDIKSIKSIEDLNAALKNEVDSRLDSTQKSLKEAQKVGAPLGDVSERIQTIDKLKKITPEYIKADNNVEFRKTAIAQDFIEKGYDSDRANAMAQRSVDAGTDVEDAEFAVAALIKSEESGLADVIQTAKDKENDSLTSIKSYISTTPEVIPGIQLNDSQKDELYNQITTDLGNKENAFMQAQKKDPTGSRIKLEALFYLTKGLTDFSVFGNASETKISNNIENLLRGANFTEEGKVNTESNDSNSNFKLSDLKDLEIE